LKQGEAEGSMSGISHGENGIKMRPAENVENFVSRLAAVSKEVPLEGAAKAAFKFKNRKGIASPSITSTNERPKADSNENAMPNKVHHTNSKVWNWKHFGNHQFV